MQQANRLSAININNLSSKFKSKKELHQFLLQDCAAYLPPLQSTNIYFYKQIVRGEKEYIRRDKVMVAAVPQIEGLTVEDILKLFEGNVRLLKHIPDERDWVHIDRKWLCDVLFTIDKANFQTSINQAIQARKERLEKNRDMMIEMRPEFAAAFSACMNFSDAVGNGRSSNLLKGSSKRKRTRAELDEVRNEEEELKDDKQAFLQQVKRLKREKDLMEDEIVQLRTASINLGYQREEEGTQNIQQQFDI